jgi:hypothetical protein
VKWNFTQPVAFWYTDGGPAWRVMGSLIDPFGAPEFFISGVGQREFVCPELLRLSFYAIESGEQILRVKLLVPVPVLVAEQRATAHFLAGIPLRLNYS